MSWLLPQVPMAPPNVTRWHCSASTMHHSDHSTYQGLGYLFMVLTRLMAKCRESTGKHMPRGFTKSPVSAVSDRFNVHNRCGDSIMRKHEASEELRWPWMAAHTTPIANDSWCLPEHYLHHRTRRWPTKAPWAGTWSRGVAGLLQSLSH